MYNEINKIILNDEWEIDDIVKERIIKTKRKYKVVWKDT